MASQNPFIVGQPISPTQFLGRKSDVRHAFNQILNRSHLALYGSAGIGKTSFLQYLRSQAWNDQRIDPSQACIIYLNCYEIDPFTPTAFWRQVLSLVKDEINDKAEGGESIELYIEELLKDIEELLKEPSVGMEDLRRVLRRIVNKNKFMVLLLDDYDAALSVNEKYTETDMLAFLATFRTLAQHTNNSLSTIVITSRRLSDLGPALKPGGSPWYNHYLFLPLKPLTDVDVNTLLNRIPFRDRLTSDLREGIREIAYGHPALLQNAGYLLYDALESDQPPEAETFIRDFETRTRHYFKNAWEFSTEVEQMLLMLIALSHLEGRLNRKRQYKLNDTDIIFSQWSRELRDLEDRGIIEITREQGKDVYNFTSSIMEWWVIKEIENSKDEEELQRREKVFLYLSRSQVEDMKTVLRQVWHHKDAVTSIVGWAGKIAGAFSKGFVGGGSP